MQLGLLLLPQTACDSHYSTCQLNIDCTEVIFGDDDDDDDDDNSNNNNNNTKTQELAIYAP